MVVKDAIYTKLERYIAQGVAEVALYKELMTSNIVEKMLQSETNWKIIEKMVSDIIIEKEEENLKGKYQKQLDQDIMSQMMI